VAESISPAAAHRRAGVLRCHRGLIDAADHHRVDGAVILATCGAERHRLAEDSHKSYYSLLLPIGLAIFVLSFVLIGITAGPSLAHHARMQTVSLDTLDLPPAAIDLDRAAATMETRCSKCHTLDRVAGARKDARGWLATVDRMSALPDSGISEADSRIIVSYLASQMAPKGTLAVANVESRASPGGPAVRAPRASAPD
jgi:hypothetical protein